MAGEMEPADLAREHEAFERTIVRQNPRVAVDIKAYYIGGRLDVSGFVRYMYPNREFNLKHGIAVVQIDDKPPEFTETIDLNTISSKLKTDFGPLRRFMVVFPFGSFVLFNASPQQKAHCLLQAKLFAHQPNDMPSTEGNEDLKAMYRVL